MKITRNRLLWIGLATLLFLNVCFWLPNFVDSRWASSGVPVTFNIAVADARTGKPISGAKVLVWTDATWKFPVNEGSVGDISATTDAQGHCKVRSHFPGSGHGNKGRLRVNCTIWIRAEGYEPWQQPMAAMLGDWVEVTSRSGIRSFPLEIRMTRKEK